MEENKKIKGYDPNTGAPIYEEEAPKTEEKKIKGYNPNTGAPIYEGETPKTEEKKIVGYNPNTGAPIYEGETPKTEEKKIVGYNPNTGAPIYEGETPKTEEKKIVGYNPNTGAPIYEGEQNNFTQPNTFAQTFENETNKKKETLCEVGFWLSLLGLIVSFVGIAFGLIIYIFDYYCAIQGLKTRKRGKAIATIVLSSVAILITIIELIMVASYIQ